MGIILGKARKLALASFNIRFILFRATMLLEKHRYLARPPFFPSLLF